MKRLDLAFHFTNNTSVEADILLGSDQYWSITTGEIVKIRNGPTALDTQLGWVLLGPVAIESVLRA